MATIIEFQPFLDAKRHAEGVELITAQLLNHGIVALPPSYSDYLPCDCEPSYQIEINAPAASLEAPDYSQCPNPKP